MAARDVPVASTMLAGRASDALHANAPSRPSAAVVAEAHALVSTAAASLPAADMSKPKATRRASQPWSAEEDMALLKAVGELGPKRWSAVSLCVGTRSGKQCRLRWCNQIDPSIRRDAWSEHEDAIIIHARTQQVPMPWVEIAKLLPGRPDNAIKNRWNGALFRKTQRSVSTSPSAGSCGTTSPPLVATAQLPTLAMNQSECDVL